MSFDFVMTQQYRRDRERDAQRERLIHLVTARRATPVDHVLVWTGRRLIALGELLQSRSSRHAHMEYPVGFLTPQL